MQGKNVWFGILYLTAIVLLVLFVVPFILTSPALSKRFDYTNSGQIGDTIGGTTGPFIALIAAFLTFLAFWIQVQANKQQTEQFNKQDTDNKINRFENKYFELIKLHKENCNDIKIHTYNNIMLQGRETFIYMFHELKYCFYVTKDIYIKNSNILEITYSDEQLLKLAYSFFYTGIGDSNIDANLNMNHTVSEIKLTLLARNELIKIQLVHDKYQESKIPYVIDSAEHVLLQIPYTPFKGHASSISHYYRHLFQTVKFVVKDSKILETIEEKLEYLRILRAQLSDYEQLLLYYNAIGEFGDKWITNKYFTDYKMIHNIPLPLADFGIIPEEKLYEDIKFIETVFEWQEDRF